MRGKQVPTLSDRTVTGKGKRGISGRGEKGSGGREERRPRASERYCNEGGQKEKLRRQGEA